MATLEWAQVREADLPDLQRLATAVVRWDGGPVSYTHLRAHET